MEPRYYQADAIEHTWEWIRSNQGNPCIVLPTGAGKSLTMALMVQDCLGWNSRVMLVTHSKELLQQLYDTLGKLGIRDVGIYSAGMDSRDTDQQVILGGIQSVYNRAEIFGHRDVLFVDEAHRINPKSEETMYGKFFTDLAPRRIVGLTATPYRLGSGLICDEDSWLTEISYEVTVGELIAGGFLCRLTSKSMEGIDTDSLRIVRGEYVESEQQQMFLRMTESICLDVIARTQDRNSVLIFCSGVEAVEATKAFFLSQGYACGAITGDTPADIRDEYIEAFRLGHIKYLANCNVLTEGFDAPNVDAVVLARATVSPGLFYQMAGRGLRLHKSKENCVILDYGENLLRHGPIDRIRPKAKHAGTSKQPMKVCLQCREVSAISARVCTTCGAEFPEAEKTEKRTSKPSDAAALSSEIDAQWYPVGSLHCRKHTKRSGDGPATMCVTYFQGMLPLGPSIARQYICVEHTGFARTKAERWWRQFHMSTPPTDAEEACKRFESLMKQGELMIPTAIKCCQSSYDPRYLEVLELTWDLSFLQDQEEVQDVF